MWWLTCVDEVLVCEPWVVHVMDGAGENCGQDLQVCKHVLLRKREIFNIRRVAKWNLSAQLRVTFRILYKYSAGSLRKQHWIEILCLLTFCQMKPAQKECHPLSSCHSITEAWLDDIFFIWLLVKYCTSKNLTYEILHKLSWCNNSKYELSCLNENRRHFNNFRHGSRNRKKERGWGNVCTARKEKKAAALVWGLIFVLE